MLQMKFIFYLFLWSIFQNAIGDDLLAKFNQNQYKIRNSRIEVESFDRNLMNNFYAVTFKYNRTMPFTNASINFKMDVLDELEFVVQFYKFASNEYRRFPIRYQMNAYKSFTANVGGMQTIKQCGNINMYFYKNIDYYFCNFAMSANKMPPLIPTGEYKMRVELEYHDYQLGIANVYLEIYIPIKLPNEK